MKLYGEDLVLCNPRLCVLKLIYDLNISIFFFCHPVLLCVIKALWSQTDLILWTSHLASHGQFQLLFTLLSLFQEKNLDWFPRMRAMSLVSSEGESEQNEIRLLQERLDTTVTLVAQLSSQLAELKEQVTYSKRASRIHKSKPVSFMFGETKVFLPHGASGVLTLRPRCGSASAHGWGGALRHRECSGSAPLCQIADITCLAHMWFNTNSLTNSHDTEGDRTRREL